MDELRVGDAEGVDEEDDEGELRLKSMRRCVVMVMGAGRASLVLFSLP